MSKHFGKNLFLILILSFVISQLLFTGRAAYAKSYSKSSGTYTASHTTNYHSSSASSTKNYSSTKTKSTYTAPHTKTYHSSSSSNLKTSSSPKPKSTSVATHTKTYSSSSSLNTKTHSTPAPKSYKTSSSAIDSNGIKRDPQTGRIERSESAKKEFMKETGYPNGRKGYVIDHIKPLACGGSDDPSNMQWQTVAEGKAKDKWERKGCK